MKSNKGSFQHMDQAKQREIASKGGKAAHRKGTAHQWTTEEAREAGRKGGQKATQTKLRKKAEAEAALARE